MTLDILIDWQEWSMDFNDHKITAQVLPLTTSAYLKLVPFMKMTEGEDVLKMAVDAYELQAMAGEIFPSFVRNLKGLKVNGVPAKLEALAEFPAFNPIAVSLITELIKISTLTEGAEKNFGKPSTSPEAGSTAKH